MENWKTIPETDGLYSVSDLGNVRRNEHYTTVKPHIYKKEENVVYYKERPVKPYIDSTGYKVVSIRNKAGETLVRKIHRLVAEAFVPNPDNYNIVNHIDENKENNNASNLEWCTLKENANHGTRNERISKVSGIRIAQYSKDGKLIKIWNSMSEAARFFGASTTTYIRRVCTNQFGRHTYKGFVWKYVDQKIIGDETLKQQYVRDKDQLVHLIKATFSKEELQEIINQYGAL